MNEKEISQRKKTILSLVVDHFIETGNSIGSSELIYRNKMKWSSATVRKEFNSLMNLGFLSQNHISSGRYPTEKGINFYIKNILNIDDLSNMSLTFLEDECGKLDGTLDYVINETGNILSDFTHLTSLATLPTRNTLRIRSAKLLNITKKNYLLMLVYEGGLAERTFIKFEKELAEMQVNRISNYLNELTLGLTIEEVKKILLDKINKIKNEYDGFLEKVLRISFELFEKKKKTDILVNGKRSLFKFLDVKDTKFYKNILEVLEEQDLLSKLLESVVEDSSTKVFVGSQNGIPEGLSLVAAPYNKGNSYGTLGVFGPTRMNYSQIIPIVSYTARVVTRLVNGGENDEYRRR
ncbi:MAG: heat-inducible transcriptional repressor HrcA [Thermodesulfobacteriota bacterium]